MLSRYAKSVGAKHYMTSAKLNQGLNELFLDLTKRTCLYSFVFAFGFPYLANNWSSTGMLDAASAAPDDGTAKPRKDKDILIDFENTQQNNNPGCQC